MPSLSPHSQSPATWPRKLAALARATIRWLLYSLATLWTAGAVYVDGPLGMHTGNAWLALGWLGVAIACLVLIRAPGKRFLAWFALCLVVLVPWLSKQPSHDRDWQPEWAELGWVELDQGELRFHNFRNFDYDANGNATKRWETRTVQLRNLQGLDYFHSPFAGDMLAHPILSFDFGPDGHIALSVETRREVGEDYSEVGGLYKMFELQYIWGDERDLIRVRTNVRDDESVYLYRTALSPEQTLYVLLDSIRQTNWIEEQPRFYNAVTANCTTSLQAQTLEFRNIPFDIRMLTNGRLDELISELGGFRGDKLPFHEMRQHAFINPAAQAAHDDPDFSTRIREGRPGFD